MFFSWRTRRPFISGCWQSWINVLSITIIERIDDSAPQYTGADHLLTASMDDPIFDRVEIEPTDNAFRNNVNCSGVKP